MIDVIYDEEEDLFVVFAYDSENPTKAWSASGASEVEALQTLCLYLVTALTDCSVL